MAEWLAKLVGEERALVLLEEYLKETEYSLTKEGTRYYLKVGDFPESTDSTVVMNTANQLIDVLNGAAILYFEHFSGVKSHIVVTAREDGTKEGRGFLTLQERTLTLTFPPQPDETLETWISTGTEDELATRALSLYGTLDHNWKNLYMVLEVIQEDVGGEAPLINKNWVSRLKDFKRTANSFRAIGREARHAGTKQKPPSSAMSLKEAQGLIRDLLKKWLKFKH